MRLAHAETTPWTVVRPVRGGTIEFKTMLEGQENTPDNYQLLLANTDVSFKSPRHRHNFDQLRWSLKDATNIGHKRNLEEGDLGYFPEGTYYGPQDQEQVGRVSLAMVVQFGGPSGSGYMSKRQMEDGFDKLRAQGDFDGGVFRRHTPAADGRMNQDAYEAIWEFQNQRPIQYSKPRFMDPVWFRESNFEWLPDAAQPGVDVKAIGSFTERGVAVHFVRIAAGARYELAAGDQTRLLFVKHGEGRFQPDAQAWHTHSAVHLDAGEGARMQADTETEVMVLALPRHTAPH